MNRTEIFKFLILRTIGNFLLLFAIFGVLATFGPALFYEVQFRIAQARGVRYTIAAPQESYFGRLNRQANHQEQPAISRFAQVLAGDKEQIMIPKDTEFGILIPKIGANAKVIPNVDPDNQSEYLQALQQGVAHAKGTVFPGFLGNTYLFAHSVDNFWDVGRYNAVFYLLKDLSVGDDVVVFFENVRHNYVVDKSIIVEPSEVEYLVNSQKTEDEKLILQTCWPPGTTWKRLLVIAVPKQSKQ